MRTSKIVLVTVLLGLLLAVIAALAFMHSGIYNIAAREPPSPLELWVTTTTREHSIERRSGNIRLPADLMEEARARRGAALYDRNCAICHLRPGDKESGLRRGLEPPPPDLTEWGSDPARTFWIVKHGIRMTGMPAWGLTYDDDTIWDIVAFLQRISGMSAEEYSSFIRTEDREQEQNEQ